MPKATGLVPILECPILSAFDTSRCHVTLSRHMSLAVYQLVPSRCASLTLHYFTDRARGPLQYNLYNDHYKILRNLGVTRKGVRVLTFFWFRQPYPDARVWLELDFIKLDLCVSWIKKIITYPTYKLFFSFTITAYVCKCFIPNKTTFTKHCLTRWFFYII